MTPPSPEPARRRAKYRQIEAEWRRRPEDLPPDPPTVPSADELRALLDAQAREPDFDRFRGALAAWRRRPRYFLNSGRTMHLGGVMDLVADDPAVIEIFLDGLRVPADAGEAELRIRRLYDLVDARRRGSAPAPGMMPLVQTNFWSRQDPDAWPVLWKNAEDFLRQVGWLGEAADPAQRYLGYREVLRTLDDHASRAADCLSWYSHERPFCGLDPSLVERCRENAALLAEWYREGAYPSAESAQAAERNAVALRAELDLAVRALRERVEQALGEALRPGSMALRTSNTEDRPFRADGFAPLVLARSEASDWTTSLDLRVWVGPDGVAVGLHPRWRSTWTLDLNRDLAGVAADTVAPAGLGFIRIGPYTEINRVAPHGVQPPDGEFVIGRWFPGHEALDRRDFEEEIVATAEALQPVAQAMLARIAPPEPRSPPPPKPNDSDGVDIIDPIPALADEILLDESFLYDIVSLLREKGQVVLYGPPGTGKTYVAKKLAEALAPEAERRMVVQFHPSTGYEDFFEGFRPESDAAGGLRYALVPGPLAILTERARLAPDVEHIMVVDEINRGNLPRILGELLFLLEYRGEAVRTLYRPDAPFALPPNLLFIGTMNTADRSIALVDAALRRRFHFVPFFPHEGPLAELLRRWLDRAGEPDWVADLLDMVNGELRDRLGGPHLQIGPSHFMIPALDTARVRRIWDYSVFPFVEEQLYGDWDAIPTFRFDALWRRFQRRGWLDAEEDAAGASGVDPAPDG